MTPSKLARIVQCPGSYRMPAAVAPRSDGTEEGIAAHWVWSQPGPLPAVGSLAPNGVPVTDEMIEGGELMRSTMDEWGADPVVEMPLYIPRIHHNCRGKPDAYAWAIPRQRLHVAEYKFGHGYVDAFQNYQLMAYAAGMLDDVAPNCIVHLTIVQPRNYDQDGHVRTWTTRAQDLQPHFDRMRDACLELEKPNAPLHVGPECKYCHARHNCVVLQRAAMDACDKAGTPSDLELPIEYAARELALLERASALLDARKSGLAEQVKAALVKGKNVPLWQLVPIKSREIWRASYAEVKALGEIVGINVTKDSLVTPTQARKMGLPADIVTQFSVRPPGGLKLEPIGNKSAKIFQSS